MALSKRTYKWFYDNIHSAYYDLLMKYCFLPAGGEKKCRMHLIKAIDFRPKERILDMCCGTGGLTFAIARKAGQEAEIIGMDLSSGQIKKAQKRNRSENIRFIERDVGNTGFEQRYFDKVFIAFALHEMPRQERLNTLLEARRVLKEGGHLIVVELDRPQGFLRRLLVSFWLFYWLPFNFESSTRTNMLKRGLTNELREAGFENLKKTSNYGGVLQVVEGER